MLELDEKTLKALPAYALVPINDKFSTSNPFLVSVRTVSDNARNPLNKADRYEQKAIEEFRKNSANNELFEKIEDRNGEFYQYSYALRIKESCLKCHSDKNSAPAFIRSKYENGYGYKVGDVRGVISVKIPRDSIGAFFAQQSFYTILFDVLVLFILVAIVFLVFRAFSGFNRELEDEVEQKTAQIKAASNDLYHYKKSLDESSIVSITDKNGIITYVNDNFVKVSGYSPQEVLGRTHSVVRHPDTPHELLHDMWQTIAAKRTWKGVIKNKKKDGGYYVVDAVIEPILDESGEISKYIAVRHDITQIFDKQKEIEQLALKDSLTGLGNRTKLILDVESSDGLALAIIDIDRFTEVNDFYGHEFGDMLLKEFAKKLSELFEKAGAVYRYGGDRFALLAKNQNEELFVSLVSTLQALCTKEPYEIDGKKIHLNQSVAISFENRKNIIQTADLALRELKKTKKQSLIYSTDLGLEKEIEKNIEWTQKIKSALEDGRIVPYFQPILNNKTNKIEKYEALVRLVEKDGKVVSPYSFLEIAKRSKQYLSITKAVVSAAVKGFAHRSESVSINLTMEDMLSDEIVLFLQSQSVREGGIVLEIVESESLQNSDRVWAFLREAKQSGFEIAIDDFGTGYSNFEYLVKLEPNFVKIDGSMIKNIDKDRDMEELVITIVDFAKKRGLFTIAEFVSSKEVFDKVVELGIDYSQGYFIGEPKPL